MLCEVVGLLTVAQRCPQAFVPVSGSEPLATRAMAVSFVWSPVGQAGHRNRAHVLKFRGCLDARRAQLVILTRPRSKEALWAREPQILTLPGHSLL